MNAIPEKRCTRCLLTMPLSYFDLRADKCGLYRSRCRDCINAARRKSSPKPSFVRPSWVPPVDFLPMGEPDRTVSLRWALGVTCGR